MNVVCGLSYVRKSERKSGLKREEVAGTWLESHFDWQIRTFWYGLLWALIGMATLVILIGFAILFANCVWIIYRVVKGWLYFNDNKPMPA